MNSLTVSSIELLKSFRPTSKLIYRGCSTKTVQRIIFLNYTSKSLFGPVIKTKATKRQKKLESDSLKESVTLSHQKNHSSEMFWILGNRWNDIETVEKSLPKRDESQMTIQSLPKTAGKLKATVEKALSKRERVIHSQPDKSKNESKSTVRKPSLKKPSEIISESKVNTRNPIPFSNAELKELLLHPLVTEKEIIASQDSQISQIRNFPSVGKILQGTMSDTTRNALINWKLAKIFELGEQGFADLQKSNLSSGYVFHWSLEHYFRTKEIPLASSSAYKLWESVNGVLDTFNQSPALVEKPLYHPTLKYKGVCDCVSDVENQLTLIEWKKSCRSKPTLDSTFDAPLQLCAYLGALNSTPEYQGRIRQGMIVVAYEDGTTADVYKLNEIMLRKYWRSWLTRLHEFWIRTRDGTMLDPI